MYDSALIFEAIGDDNIMTVLYLQQGPCYYSMNYMTEVLHRGIIDARGRPT